MNSGQAKAILIQMKHVRPRNPASKEQVEKDEEATGHSPSSYPLQQAGALPKQHTLTQTHKHNAQFTDMESEVQGGHGG